MDMAFHYGEPARANWKKYPFGWVQWIGGQNLVGGMGVKDNAEHTYAVVLCYLAQTTDIEQTFYEKAEAVEAIVKNNRTLSSTVDYAHVVRSQRIPFPDNVQVVQFRISIVARLRA